MERLLPIDLERARLPRRFRGYDCGVVDLLMTRAGTEIERLRKELMDARRMADQALTELERHRADEQSLRETLLLAQRAADDVRAAARREADALVADARRAYEDAKRDAEMEVQDLRWEIDRLDRERESLVFRIRGVLDETARILERDGATVTKAEAGPRLGLVLGEAPSVEVASSPADAV